MYVLTGVHLALELLCHSIYVCSSLVDAAKQFSKVLPIYTLTRSM